MGHGPWAMGHGHRELPWAILFLRQSQSQCPSGSYTTVYRLCLALLGKSWRLVGAACWIMLSWMIVFRSTFSNLHHTTYHTVKYNTQRDGAATGTVDSVRGRLTNHIITFAAGGRSPRAHSHPSHVEACTCARGAHNAGRISRAPPPPRYCSTIPALRVAAHEAPPFPHIPHPVCERSPLDSMCTPNRRLVAAPLAMARVTPRLNGQACAPRGRIAI